MRKLYTLFIVFFAVTELYAQTPNTVGIGTNTPNQKLDVNGWIKIGDQTAPVPPNSHDEGSIRYNSTSKTVQINLGGSSSDWTNIVPAGVICMWSGSFASIPTGWALCDGTSGTPDLRDKFILGAVVTGDVGNTGGNNSITLSTSQLPSHSHTGTTDATAPSLTFTGTPGTTSAPATQTFAGTLGTTSAPATQTFAGTLGITSAPATQTFAGTSGTTSAPATQTFTGASSTTNSVTPTFAGTANQTTAAPATQTFTGASSTTNSVTPTFTGTSNQSTSNDGAHTHTDNIRNCCRGYWSAYNGSNETAQDGAGTGTTSSNGAHTHTFTATGTISAISHTVTPLGSINVGGSVYTATGTITAISHTVTPLGSISVGGSAFTPAGTLTVGGSAFTPAGTLTVGGSAFTPAGTLSVSGSAFTPAGTISGSNHTHTFTTGTSGTGASIDIRPSFYKLAYIMKL